MEQTQRNFLPLQKIEHRRKRSDLPTANVSRCRNEKFDLGILARQERDDRHSGRYDRRRVEAPTLHVAVERSIQFRIGQLVAGVLVFRRNLLQPVSRFVVSIGGSDVLVVKRHYTFGFGLDTQIFGFDRL